MEYLTVKQPKELTDLRKEYVKKVLAWIEEQAKNPNVDRIEVELTYWDFEQVYPSVITDMNGWQGDYWKEPVEIAGRKWHVYGSMAYGTLELHIED